MAHRATDPRPDKGNDIASESVHSGVLYVLVSKG